MLCMLTKKNDITPRVAIVFDCFFWFGDETMRDIGWYAYHRVEADKYTSENLFTSGYLADYTEDGTSISKSLHTQISVINVFVNPVNHNQEKINNKMSNTAIEFEHVSKQYRLGLVSTKTLSHDIRRFWITNVLGKEDPYLKKAV